VRAWFCSARFCARYDEGHEVTIYGKKRWYRRLGASTRRHPAYWMLIGVGLLLVAGAGTAAAAIALTGKGTVTAPAYNEQQLQVTDEHLSLPLVPGGSADLVFLVRNPNPFPARVDGVALASSLRKAKPAGCTARVSGPITRAGGYRLPAAARVTVPAGARVEVTAPAAFKLAGAARGGCGFTVDILVSAVQGTAAAPSSPGPDPEPPVESPSPPPATTKPTTTAPPPVTDQPDEDPQDGGVIPPPALG
jgi:hypothetical protein